MSGIVLRKKVGIVIWKIFFKSFVVNRGREMGKCLEEDVELRDFVFFIFLRWEKLWYIGIFMRKIRRKGN